MTVDVWDVAAILIMVNCVANAANTYLGNAMIINNKPIYLIRYPWGGEIPPDEIVHIAKYLAKQIQALDPKAECLAIPNDLSLEKMNIEDIENLVQTLSDYVLDIRTNYQEEEEE